MNFLSARELASRMRRKELSSREVLDAHLTQIERFNPEVNAIVTLAADQARERAYCLDEEAAHGRFAGPLHGLPIAHKDLNETRGIRTTYGSPIYRDYVPDFNSLIVDRIQQAGAVTLGKTNTPEFGAGSQTFNPVFGATLNPWDPTRTCGGSSGGAAVALACGMLPIADGSDMGGSLRNPASFCSVVGFRISSGRIPRVPPSELSVDGPMARNVADVAFFLSAIADPDPQLSGPLERDCKGIRIAWCSNFAGVPFDRRTRAVFEAARPAFQAIGCVTEDADPDFSGADESFGVLRAAAFYQNHGSKPREQMKRTVVHEIERGGHLTAAEVADAERLRADLRSRIAAFMAGYDFLVLPTTQVPPFDITQEYVSEIDSVKMESYIDWMRSCYFITMTALPAISVPAGFTPEGLPVGVQIVGRSRDDFGVLQIAHAFEQAHAGSIEQAKRQLNLPRRLGGSL
jgi:amidase